MSRRVLLHKNLEGPLATEGPIGFSLCRSLVMELLKLCSRADNLYIQ